MTPHVKKQFIVVDSTFKTDHQDLLDLARHNRGLHNHLIPDEFWTGINLDHEFYTVGFEEFDSSLAAEQVPKQINGIPVVLRRGNGRWSWNGPGQLAMCLCIHQRTFQHRGFMDEIARIARALSDCITERYAVPCRIDGLDAGIYHAETGAKLVSHTFYYIDKHLIMVIAMNFSAPLDRFKHIDVCGVKNRHMGNILPQGQELSIELARELGDDMVTRIWQNIYETSKVNLYINDTDIQITPL